MRKIAYMVVIILGVYATGVLLHGWGATPQTLRTKSDALSVCVRSVGMAEISLLKLPACLHLTLATIERREGIERTRRHLLQLEENFRVLDEVREDFGKYREGSQVSRTSPGTTE